MKYKKIHIIGGPGSGKSYLAKKLSGRYSIPCYDLDDIFWDKNQREYIRTPEEARQKKLSTILKNDSWIIEGVYYKWLADSFEDADKIVVHPGYVEAVEDSSTIFEFEIILWSSKRRNIRQFD
jgi:adenylate kinase family enzyme